jgi:hypothetical protein
MNINTYRENRKDEISQTTVLLDIFISLKAEKNNPPLLFFVLFFEYIYIIFIQLLADQDQLIDQKKICALVYMFIKKRRVPPSLPHSV